MVPQTAINGAKYKLAIGKTGINKRNIPIIPTFNKTPAKITEPVVGASTCAFGNHKCIGTKGVLIANAKKIADERINKRIPLAYILNEAWLMGYSFYADPRSIIPRSFIAELIIDGTLEPWLPEDAKVLDLCTGNASLAIIMSLTYPDVNLSAADISEQALALAAKNLIRHKLSRKIALFQGDLYSALPLPTEENRFNLIICNPPYVNDYSMQNLPPEFLAEPHISLAGGHKGMDLIKKILSQSKLYLKKNGAVLLEIGHEFDNFCEVFPNINFTALDVSSSHNSVLLVSFEDLP